MADKSDKKSTADEAEAPGQGGKSAIMVMVAGLVVGAASGVFFVGPMVAGQPDSAESHESGSAGGYGGESSGDVHTHLVQGLIVNPAGTGGTRILLISVAVVLDTEDAVTEAEERDPEVRDVLLGVLATKTVDELTDISRREELKGQLLVAVQSLELHGEVLQIHIPQFVVQ